jgi:hypothetical protein
MVRAIFLFLQGAWKQAIDWKHGAVAITSLVGFTRLGGPIGIALGHRSRTVSTESEKIMYEQDDILSIDEYTSFTVVTFSNNAEYYSDEPNRAYRLWSV